MDTLLPLIIFSTLGVMVLRAVTLRLGADEQQWLLRLLLAAFALRMLVATLFALVPEARVFHEDADGYEAIGLAIANGWHGSGPPISFVAEQNYGYYYVTGAIYFLVGAFRPAASYSNALLGTVNILLIYRLARRFFHIAVARRAALMVALFPSMILWSSLAIKDTAVTFLILLALHGSVRLKERFSVGRLLATVLPLVAIQPLRFYMLYFLGLATLGALFFERGARSLAGAPKLLLIVGAGALVLLAAGFSGSAMQGAEFLDLQHVSSFRQGMAETAHSGFAADVDISTPERAIAFLPLGVAVLLFSPFPWQLTSLRAALAMPETIVWWLLFPSTIRGLRFAIAQRFGRTSPIILFTFALIPAYALIHGNVGSGFRQRAQIFVLLFIFTALGQYLQRVRQRRIDPGLLLADETLAGERA
jgi:hypothetical protein